MTNTDETPKPSRAGLAALLGVGIAALGLVAIYWIERLPGNAENTLCQSSAPLAARLRPYAKGEVAAINVASSPALVRDLTFQRPDGTATSLAGFRGRTVLLNLWATWCAPCRKEMPALDQLQARLGGDTFEVVAVNIDTRDGKRAETFLNDLGVTNLTRYKDPSAEIFQDLRSAGKAFGLPTTLLIDGQGCELANLAGPAEWASEDAVAFVKAALGREL